jgi:hypothetical protein
MKTLHRIVVTDEYIKNAQHLMIAQNTTLRLIYQTWWIWWLPRVAIAGAMGFLLFEGYALETWITSVFLLSTFLGEFLSRRTLAKARNRSKSKGSTTTVTMDENGVDIEGALGKSHLKWAALLPPAITPNGVFLRFSRLSGAWLPDEALVEGSANDVRQLLIANTIAS